MLSARDANRRYFRDAYRTGEHGWAAREPSPYAVRLLRRAASLSPGGRLLEVGCGEGRHCVAAARLGFQVVGADCEPLALRRARAVAGQARAEGIAFLCANVYDLPFEDETFDVVLDYGCLHHQRKADWPAYRAEVARALRPAGHYLVSVFTPRFRLFSGSRRRWHIAGGAYRRCFTEGDLRAFLGPGFEVVELAEERGEGRGFLHCLARRVRPSG